MRSIKPEFSNLSGDEEDITDAFWDFHEVLERNTSGYGSLFLKALEIIKRLDTETTKLQGRIEELETEEEE